MGFFGSVRTGKQFDWVLEGWREARRRSGVTGLVVIGARTPCRMRGGDQEGGKEFLYLDASSVIVRPARSDASDPHSRSDRDS